MEVEVITNFSEFLALEGIWNDLLKHSDNDTVFLTHEWFRCWWLGYGDGKQLFILLVKNKGEVIGIAPLILTPGWILLPWPARKRPLFPLQ